VVFDLRWGVMWLAPYVSSRYSRESVVSSSPSDFASEDLRWWATSSGTPMLVDLSWRGWKNRPWILLLCSLERFKTWTEANSLVTLMSSVGGSHANHIQLLETKKETKTTAPSGPSSPESLPSVDPPWSSSRTSQLSLLGEDFDLSERNYADWVTNSQIRSSLALATLARHMSVRGSSFWPTATSTDQKMSGVSENWLKESGRHSGTTLTDAVKKWQTPKNSTGGNVSRSGDRKGELLLSGQAKSWATPTAHDGRRPGKGDKSTQGRNLKREVNERSWPTPAARDVKGTNAKSFEERGGKTKGEQLPNFVKHKVGPWAKGEYPTPSATRYGSSQNEGSVAHDRPSRGTPSLETWASSHLDPTMKEDGSNSSKSDLTFVPRLNPAFVSWLMGYPWFWTRATPISFGAAETRWWLLRVSWLFSGCFDRR